MFKKGNKFRFKRGNAPWNKGKKGQIPWNKGLTKEISAGMKKVSESRMGEKHPLWVGNKVTYRALHAWVERQLGKPKECAFCGSIENLHWANKDHKYKRDLQDWISLCCQCHQKYDLRKRNKKGQYA